MPDGDEQVIGTLLAIIIATGVMLVGTAIVADIDQSTEEITSDVTREDVLLSGAGTWVTVADGTGSGETVYKTTGYAVNLTGSNDSYVQSADSIDISTDENWSVSVWARADREAAGANMTAVSLNGQLLIWWNGTAGNWSAWYYDEGATNSYQVNVSDNGEQPGNFTNIIVNHNSTHLEIYRNNTRGDVKNVTGSSITAAPVNSTNWDGRIEELRTFDQTVDATNRSGLVGSPVEQQPDLNRTARIMFDQPDRSTQVIIFTNTHLTQSNVTFSAGFDKQIMDGRTFGNDLLGSTDYEWDENGPRIRPTAGGELDGAPIVYVSYDFGEAKDSIREGFRRAMNLGSLVPTILMALLILGLLVAMRSRL